jgi:polysaccharide export outer membrane protein
MNNLVNLLLAWLLGTCITLSGLATSGAFPDAQARESGDAGAMVLVQSESAKKPRTNSSTAGAPDSNAYRVDTGDRISVTVYQEPDLSVQGVRVKDNGTIALPLLGDLQVAGLTSRELRELIVERLLDGYLKQPSVAVSIDGYRLYYIKGEVNRPGGYSFLDGLTVAKAVALAGGYTVRASERSISLIRESDPENPMESVGPNTAIIPGDIITVGESFF